MTVKELIKELKKYDKNMQVAVTGGEGAYGDWAYLAVFKKGKHIYDADVDVLLESDE